MPPIYILDIETVPSLPLIAKHCPECVANTPLQTCENFFNWCENKHKTRFPPLYMHQIVSIACVIATPEGSFKSVGNFGKGCSDEKALVADFLAFFNRHQPKLVTFNGRAFDLPLLMLKALAYNLNAHTFYTRGDKWENYRYRYSEEYHTDLLDSLAHFGPARGLNLDGVCAVCNLPGKFDVSGDQIYQLYYQDPPELERIHSYCQSDVLNTYWLYLKYLLSCGTLSEEGYLSTLHGLKSNLPEGQPYTPIFSKALEIELTQEIQKEDHV
ncbi:3'-5' exonuclease [Helicobacter heilmannii]|uniref:3'-5' exonuclease n=1 Tax=Helicobacter heilmannii TaxID=35817 RepID=UPI0006A0AC9B|nr:3'-5' exonuclease [Helicobacter heilmannii]CRF45294.1 Polysaccharide biosynthesis protein WlaX [Helicobacter heilmannii]